MSDRQVIRIESKRGFVALVLALFALGWLAERAHVAFETHEFCAEHQRIEHGPDSAHDEAVHAHDAAGPVFEALDLDSDTHAACCTLLARGDDPIELPTTATRVFLVLALERSTHAYAWGTSSRASIEIVRFAPKQSPPAVCPSASSVRAALCPAAECRTTSVRPAAARRDTCARSCAT